MKLNSIFILMLFALLIFCGECSYAQQCQWVKTVSVSPPSLGIASQIYTGSIISNNQGELYATGGFVSDSGTVHFGNNYYSALNTSASRFLLLKYKTDGSIFWSKSTPYDGDSNGVGGGSKIIEDDAGNLFVGGSYSGQKMIFDYDTIWNNCWEGGNMFLGKFDKNGNTIWVINTKNDTATGHAAINCSDICLDKQGNIYITGSFSGKYAVFDNDTIWNYDQNTPLPDIFVAKYNPNGKLAWVRQAGGPLGDGGSTIIIHNNEIYATGGTVGSLIYFGNIAISCTTYFAKYDTAGNVIWVKGINGALNWDMKKGWHGDFYFTGIFNSLVGNYVVFDTDTVFMSIPNTAQAYLACYDTSGHIKWAKQSGKGISGGQTLFLDNKGRLFGAGHYAEQSFICGNDSLPYINQNTTSSTLDIYIGIYDTVTGNPIKAFRIGGGNDDYIHCLSAYNDSLYVTGNFTSQVISFGNCQANLQSPLCRDWYLAKYILPPTGINDVPKETDESVYPNPFINTIFIQTLNPKQATFYLYDSFGKLVFTKTILENKEQINTTNLAEGLYFYSIVNHNGERVKAGKVVKE